MSKKNKTEKDNLNTIYISERLKACLRPVACCALTTVVAPMGYGKTTAINWFLDEQGKQIGFMAVPAQGFWKERIELTVHINKLLTLTVRAKSESRAATDLREWEYDNVRFSYELPLDDVYIVDDDDDYCKETDEIDTDDDEDQPVFDNYGPMRNDSRPNAANGCDSDSALMEIMSEQPDSTLEKLLKNIVKMLRGAGASLIRIKGKPAFEIALSTQNDNDTAVGAVHYCYTDVAKPYIALMFYKQLSGHNTLTALERLNDPKYRQLANDLLLWRFSDASPKTIVFV